MIKINIPESPLMRGKLEVSLNRTFRFSDGIRTLKAELLKRDIVRKTTYTRTHETRRTNLTYRELSEPNAEYTLWDINGAGLPVPKIVYDSVEVTE